MRFEIYQDGKLKWTVESTDKTVVANDIIILPKSLANNCSLSTESFDELFFNELKTSSTHIEAYEKAENVHYEYFEKRKYSSYESFKANMYRNHKKK